MGEIEKELHLAYAAQGQPCKTCERGNECNGFECLSAFERGLTAYQQSSLAIIATQAARIAKLEKALEPLKRIADDIPSSFSDETVVSIGIDYKLSAEQVADIQGMSGGTIKSDRATIVLSMACMQASHFRAARSAINLIRGDE